MLLSPLRPIGPKMRNALKAGNVSYADMSSTPSCSALLKGGDSVGWSGEGA